MAMRIDQAWVDPNLFGAIFKPAESWRPSVTQMRAAFALPPDEYDLDLFRRCAGPRPWPTRPVRTLVDTSGRRSGKSQRSAAMAVWAAIQDYSEILSAGERGVVVVIAGDRPQARIIMNYIKAILALPLLAPLVERQLEESVHLTSGIVIEVHTSNYRTVRGYTVVFAALDEIAFWRSDQDSANPDTEIVAAIKPAMSTVRNAMLIASSTPYWRRGWLWEQYDRYFAKDRDDVLVWQAPTTVMNPSFDPAIVEQALREDEPRARAEYLAEFRTDVEAFVSFEVVRGCIVPHRTELPPVRGTSYAAFTDPSGGSADSWTLCIGHRTRDERIVVDALRERRAPFVPSEICSEFSALLAAYHCTEVSGDRYAGEWPREQFRAHGITYRPAERNKSQLYTDLLPILNGRGVELPDNPRLVAQLVSLERVVSRGGRDSVDHPKRAHDDLSNSLAGVVALLARKRLGASGSTTWGGSWESDASGLRYFSKDGVELLCIEPDDPQAAQKAFVAERMAQARR